jgi:hypothetical protein
MSAVEDRLTKPVTLTPGRNMCLTTEEVIIPAQGLIANTRNVMGGADQGFCGYRLSLLRANTLHSPIRNWWAGFSKSD